MVLSKSQTHDVTLFLESLFYGVYCVLCAIVLYILFSGRKVSRAHQAMFAIAITMFLVSTVHILIVFLSTIAPFASSRGARITMVAAGNLMVSFGDSILVWRVWAVWKHKYWVVILPSIILTVGTALGFYSAANLNLSNSLAPQHAVAKLASAFVLPTNILSMVNTILCTSLIVGRIRYIEYKTHKLVGTTSSRNSTYRGIIMLLVESGSLYALLLILSLILNYTSSTGLPIYLTSITPLFGILPTLIIILVHLEMVPGTRANEVYAETVRTQLGTRPDFAAMSQSHSANSGNIASDIAVGRIKGETLGEWKARSRHIELERNDATSSHSVFSST